VSKKKANCEQIATWVKNINKIETTIENELQNHKKSIHKQVMNTTCENEKQTHFTTQDHP